ncbi:hypothetical protein DL990_20170 [Amycolatopsis sp. WAC 01416]|uniref:hypothetical protein n=1 Tax=Amycolatopsis sp. WAC 01416 TaxID=2203196 RepID=UPI000F78BCF7|nr:hypothetical protein [Amycolatopsis sp. WAC 01416]RSN32233.1 hypothetical protein DL990_20170 [Amycolatopsis sp. WAC 01416]
MFLPMPDLVTTDAYACFGVRHPTVLVLDDGSVFAVGFTRPDIARDAIGAAALDIGVPLPTRDDAGVFRLAWFAYTHALRHGDPIMRRAAPGEDGAFPVIVWRAVDIDTARAVQAADLVTLAVAA